MERIDVVIPTGKNVMKSNYSIIYTIRSIISQTVQPASITVVENGEELGVAEVIDDFFGEFVTVTKGLKKIPNISYARNIGVSNGTGDIILFLDDDVILAYTDYFARVLSIMKHCDFCCGAKRYWTPTNWHDYISLNYPFKHNLLILDDISYRPQSIERRSGDRNCSEYSYIGNFGAIRRSVFDKIGGFDEEYEGWLYQDTDLMMRLVYEKYTYEVLAYTDMKCFHLSHPADKEKYRDINYTRYLEKQKSLGVRFNNKNFFGRFEKNDYSVISPYNWHNLL